MVGSLVAQRLSAQHRAFLDCTTNQRLPKVVKHTQTVAAGDCQSSGYFMQLTFHRAAYQVSQACKSALLGPTSSFPTGAQSFAHIYHTLLSRSRHRSVHLKRAQNSVHIIRSAAGMDVSGVMEQAEGAPIAPPSSQAESANGFAESGNGLAGSVSVPTERSSSHAEGSNGLAETTRLVLGIETSCDETGAAVVSTDGKILGEALASSAAIHAQWGGVVPALAKGEHEKAIDGVSS
jgi:hypothetical protein